MPEFFMPGADDENKAIDAWLATKTFAEQSLGWVVSERLIFRLAYTHDGDDFVATVGEVDDRTGDLVVAILESNTYLVCTPNRGVLRGEPILVGREEAFEVEDFTPND